MTNKNDIENLFKDIKAGNFTAVRDWIKKTRNDLNAKMNAALKNNDCFNLSSVMRNMNLEK